PVELLDGPDQAERSFLDQVEEGEALVSVVLRDRDDEAQVRLDHVGLGTEVAALDALRELHLLRCSEQRVGRRLVRNREWGRRRLLLLLFLLLELLRRVRDLDSTALELVPDRVGLE